MPWQSSDYTIYMTNLLCAVPKAAVYRTGWDHHRSLLCGILSLRPVLQPARDLTRPFCLSAIRFSSCRKPTSEGTSGSCCLAFLIPDQPFIYNGTLISVAPCGAEQIWKRQRGAEEVLTCEGGRDIEAKQKNLQSAETRCFFSLMHSQLEVSTEWYR